ncbi:MAG: mannitol dehydrogenase family protein [Acidimicrobiales bacterium]
MTALNAGTLRNLPKAVHVPEYDPKACQAGIVHFGVGAFHRAHEAMFVDRLLALGLSTWSICGVGVLEADRAMRDVLRDQDNLYTLVTLAPDGTAEARVVGSLTEYLYAPDDPQAVLRKLASPLTRIVSLTITEGGYSVSDTTGEFQPEDPLTMRDLASDGPPVSVLGFITAGLVLRRARSLPPFTVMSCDNLAHNGDVTRTAVLGFAKRKYPELVQWAEDNVMFPNSMVDRITPATTDETRAYISATFGVDDRWPVRSEQFCQWVLEDRFANGRPPFEKAGVQMVDDVGPYELMKLRLLNASHQVMSYLGLLAGATWVHEVCRDPLFVQLLLAYMHEEAIPTLPPVPGIDLDAYCDGLIARFASEAVKDTLERQVVDGSDRIAKFLLPVVREQLRKGGEVRRSVLALAAWSTFLEDRLASGGTSAVTDRRAEQLASAIEAERQSPGAFLGYQPVFGDLGSNGRLRATFITLRGKLRDHGARATISEALHNSH